MSGTGERIVSIKTLKLDMRALLKQIIEFDRVLPRLPSEFPQMSCFSFSTYGDCCDRREISRCSDPLHE
jgi:hypothetical protein